MFESEKKMHFFVWISWEDLAQIASHNEQWMCARIYSTCNCDKTTEQTNRYYTFNYIYMNEWMITLLLFFKWKRKQRKAQLLYARQHTKREKSVFSCVFFFGVFWSCEKIRMKKVAQCIFVEFVFFCLSSSQIYYFVSLDMLNSGSGSLFHLYCVCV